MNLFVWQAIYIAASAAILPFSPFLYLQGQYTRRKVGLLPDAAGETTGTSQVGAGEPANLLVLGESTVAGLGARTHEKALAGRFAFELSRKLDRPVRWTVVGKSGVTAARTMTELLPLVPDERFDYILLGLGGNDVLKLSSPRKWRRDMTRLISLLREKSPGSVIFVTNCPMIVASPVIPQPAKGLLWQLSRLHDRNIRDFSARMDRVFYYHQPTDFNAEGFFADGIHPSEQGYADWSAAMVKFFGEKYDW
jgi:lysophospholipase L1-like esterase